MSSISKAKKELAQEQLIEGALYDIKAQREAIEKLVADYFNYAIEAAEMGEDDYARELLAMQVDLKDFASDLKAIEFEVRTTAVTAKVLGNLRSLPDALDACKKIFSKGPNFTKLGKSMTSLRDSLSLARKQFKKLRESISTKGTYSDVFGKDAVDSKRQAKIKEAEKALEAALLQRQKGGVVSPVDATASAAATDGATQAAAAKVDAIAALLDEEKKRKP